MAPDGRVANAQLGTDAVPLGKVPAPVMMEDASQKLPIHARVLPSTPTRAPIGTHQGQPPRSSSTESGHFATQSSPSPGTGQYPKPQNVFSNDGSFLERLQRLKQEEGNKRKETELLERKKQFADRFKNRGKRAHSELSASSSSGDGSASGSASASDSGLLATPESLSKRVKREPLNQYQREMQKVNTENLSGDGIGVRPLTK